ncbi:methionyl-tRNA formyltransferase [Olsenella urininfantis]|uniref:methionyl-tRNA formyltransferase n=1 Tax=Olsenella urininfantis TaxID=1871033 RepID=UPI000985177C|nr:methionyl-tRNA formyltransferase [Olsenella urininfantis]
MRVVFMGTPSFAVPSLSRLAQAHEPLLVVTRPDAVRGRGRALVPSPVKERALGLGLPVLETKRVTPEVLERVAEARPDVIAVAAFGCILPDELLELAPLGCVNVHGSLLPRWRGAAPIQRAVLSGDERVGISIMRVVHDLDAGAWCRQASVELAEKTCAELMGELAELGASELVLALEDIAAGRAVWREQEPELVSYAAKIDKAEMLLDPTDGALENRRRVQASLDAAPARLCLGGKGVRVLDARVSSQEVEQGQVLVRKGRVFLGCSSGSVELLLVKPDGKREMPASSWASGLRGSLSWGVA